MRITGFKLLKNGNGGIEVDGYDLVETGMGRSAFRDTVKRTRNFPLTMTLKNAVSVLKYPFLVGTEHWRTEYAQFMKPDFTAPNRSDEFLNEPNFKRLVSFWESTNVVKCSIDKGVFKISGEVECSMGVVKANILVEPGTDTSLYSFVEEALVLIRDLVEQTLSLPQVALTSGTEMREIIHRLDPDGDEPDDDLTDEQAFMLMMDSAKKKGYAVMLDDNTLSMITQGIPDDPDDETFLLGAKEQLPQFTEGVEDMADVASLQTKDEGIFQQEPEEHAEPDPEDAVV